MEDKIDRKVIKEMKWKNKGHEFDDVYENILQKTELYLFGAGDYGRQFLNAFQDEFRIIAFIDNDKGKRQTKVNSLNCISLEELKLTSKQGIVITMSQFNRIQPITELEEKGYAKNRDFFVIEEFISIYNVYKYGKVYFQSVSLLPSTVCNLNCRNCLNFNPFAKKFYCRDWDELKRDVDLFFKCVDHIMLFHVSGGEPMLYKYTADIIEYIDSQYGDRVDVLRTVTNGTVVPSDEVLKKLSDCNVEITVDDYRESVPQYQQNFDALIEKLNQFQIKYYINKVDAWIDLAPEKTDYSNLIEDQIIIHRDECNQSWQELRDGKLYSCNYAAYATVAGIAGEQDVEEVFDLRNFTSDKKKELVEFRLGYTNKGYTNFCRKCKGFTAENNVGVMPAMQMEKR